MGQGAENEQENRDPDPSSEERTTIPSPPNFETLHEEPFPPSPPEVPQESTQNLPNSPQSCVDRVRCPGKGSFARCPTCDSTYFHCSRQGEEGAVRACPGHLVFNPIPTFPFCVLSTNCPRHPGPDESTVSPPDGSSHFPFGCKDTFDCVEDGSFARCSDCRRDYFLCSRGILYKGECPGYLVFSPHPKHPFCMLKETCFSHLKGLRNATGGIYGTAMPSSGDREKENGD